MSAAGVDALLTAAAAAEVPEPDPAMLAAVEKRAARAQMMTAEGEYADWILSIGTRERNKWIGKAKLTSVEQVDLLTKTRRYKQRLSKKKQTHRKKVDRDKVQRLVPDYEAAAKRAQATILAQKAYATKLTETSPETTGGGAPASAATGTAAVPPPPASPAPAPGLPVP